MTRRKTLTAASLVVLAVFFIALVVVSNALLRGIRLDLTEHRLYTLSEGTRQILADLDEPINLYLFFSERATREFPLLRNYANRVRELLDEFVLHAGGKLRLQVVDPPPFSEDEDRAAGFGLQALPVGAAGDSVYFGLAGTNAVDGVEVIEFFQPDKEAFLEYDLVKLVYSLAHPKKPVIGLLSSLPLDGGFDPLTGQMREPWIITDQLRQFFQIHMLESGLETIDADVDVLLLVHPKGLSERALYAIDQFVLGGGKVMAFLDPHAEAEPSQDPTNPTAALFAERASDLPKLLEAWGVAFDKARVLADRHYALTVGGGSGQAPVRHLAILGFDPSALARDDVVTAALDNVTVAMAGFFEPREDTETRLIPLIESSPTAMPVSVDRVRLLPDPAALQKDFQPTGERYVVAARVQGEVKSAFADGPPEGADATAHRIESEGPVNLILVADADLLSDRLWVQVQDFFGNRIATAWADNGSFVGNGLDNLTGNSDLIGIRGRATASRPFTTVQALEREAENRLRATEQQLLAELDETERRLAELQSRRDDDNLLILSDAQRAELVRFQERKLEIRQELRQVRRDLDKDIERLGTILKIVNIGLVPLLVSILALAVVWLRTRRLRPAGAAP